MVYLDAEMDQGKNVIPVEYFLIKYLGGLCNSYKRCTSITESLPHLNMKDGYRNDMSVHVTFVRIELILIETLNIVVRLFLSF